MWLPMPCTGCAFVQATPQNRHPNARCWLSSKRLARSRLEAKTLTRRRGLAAGRVHPSASGSPGDFVGSFPSIYTLKQKVQIHQAAKESALRFTMESSKTCWQKVKCSARSSCLSTSKQSSSFLYLKPQTDPYLLLGSLGVASVLLSLPLYFSLS